jgi:MarR-like DNA-binding transcriptional regulator SgrR of sgrS sRNA
VSASLRRAQAAPQTEWALAAVASIAHTEDAIVLELRRPEPELAARLALPQLAVTPLGRAPAPRAPIGSGPFRVRRVADAARRVELDASADCFAGRPYLDGVTLRWFEDADDEARAYEAGEADVSLRGAIAFSGHQPKFATVDFEGPATVMTYLTFGRARGALLADPELRAAISLAVGRASFRHIGSGERVVPSVSPVPPDLQPGRPNGELSPAPEQARAALARVAARYGKLAGLELLVDRSRPEDVDVATRIIAALDRVGVTATYVVLAPADLERRITAGLFDVAVGQMAASALDPVAAYAAAFAAGGDRWAAAKLREGPLSVEAAAAAFGERLPVVPLFHRALRAHHKKTLRGLGGDALGRLAFADAYVWTGPADVVGQDAR